jgi:alpha-beta hydrolase superfamily lysophospholipase
MTGQSMGGGVALTIMENFSKNYNGALAMCPLYY